MGQEEILEVLKNRIPTSWKFQMDKEGFDVGSSTINIFTKKCVHYKKCELAMSEMLIAACKSPSEREDKCKSKCKVEESYCNCGQTPQQHHTDGS
eukprot:9902120-Ditylum_brightwellii.AAC.1